MAVAIADLITPAINKPARYLGNELGAVHKPWENATVRWVLTYPEVYELGASNLGHIILYSILNDQPDQLCDRTYLPAPDLTAKLRETDTPLFALESRRSLLEFDIIGFSLSYELGATNILEMLQLAQIPLTWQERAEGNYPLIFAGGQTATSNPEPYSDFFDFIALGDGEDLLPEIGKAFIKAKQTSPLNPPMLGDFEIEQQIVSCSVLNNEETNQNSPKSWEANKQSFGTENSPQNWGVGGANRINLLLKLAQVPGVYVPQFYDRLENGSVIPNREDVPKQILRRVSTPNPDYSIGLVPYIETIHDRLTIEIRRGCTRGCRFCQPGMLTRPARDVEPEAVVKAIEKGIRETGYNEFSLLSLSCSDYLALPAVGIEIRNRLQKENISLSLPSQRVDRFDENIANIIGGNRQGGLTFAPEAGTQRLRDVINKGLTNEELLRGITTAVDQGWDKVKLYFMIGLPGETDEDVLGIAETVRWLRKSCLRPRRKPLEINLTISNFTPKPHTPFQWHTVSTKEFIRKQALLKAEFKGMRHTKINYTDVRLSAMEDFVGRGDRRLGAVIKRAWELGAGMDSWWENLDRAYGAWEQAIEESGLGWKYRQVEQGEWIFGEKPQSVENPYDIPLPWDHLDTGIDKKWLQKDLQKALEAATVPDCSFDGCSACGVCGSDFGHNVIVPPLPIPEFKGEFQPNNTRVQRFRVTFGKVGSMALVSHLDLVRLFDRLMRRAAIPIAYSAGFHPKPKIAIANALPLGATSSGEIVDFELTEILELAEFERRLKAVFPAELPIHQVELVDLKAPANTALLDWAEYQIQVSLEEAVSQNQWHSWIEQILAQEEILLEKKTKSGKAKTLNLREHLFALTCLEIVNDPTDQITLIYRGSGRNDGTLLQPEHIIYMLEQVVQRQFELLKIHRQQFGLILATE